MSQSDYRIEKIEDFDIEHIEVLKSLINKLIKILSGKRDVMYSDIINLIIRGNYKGEIYNHLIRWCNIQIKHGKFIIEY